MSAENDLIGIRPEDLTEEERARQAALLEASPDLRAAHEEALALGGDLRDLPAPSGGPSRADVLARVKARREKDEGEVVQLDARRRWGPYVALLAVAAAALLVVTTSDESPMRDKGGAGPPGSVQLEAVAEGPGGLRTLGPGAEVRPDEQVIFRARTTGKGALVLVEEEGRIWPPAGERWVVSEGTHSPGTGDPLAWRPDAGPGSYTYEARYCRVNDETACTTDRIALTWVE